MFEGLRLKDGKEPLGCIEAENIDHHLGHVELRLKELVVLLICLHMRIDRLLGILPNLLLVYFEQIKSDIVSICLQGIGEEIDRKWNFGVLQVEDREPKPPGEN